MCYTALYQARALRRSCGIDASRPVPDRSSSALIGSEPNLDPLPESYFNFCAYPRKIGQAKQRDSTETATMVLAGLEGVDTVVLDIGTLKLS